jgi:hypothetical protein
MELASCFVLYATAFVAIVQIGHSGAQRSITHLTLIAGFASTLFWPLTSTLHAEMSWRGVFLVFAGLNLLLCLPIHAWIARLSRRRAAAAPTAGAAAPAADGTEGIALAPGRTRTVFFLMLAGFALEGFVLTAILIHLVPLLTGLGLGAAGVLASTFYGPAQVASRLINMVFGGRLRQTTLAVIAASLLMSGLALLILSGQWIVGIGIFVVLFGLGGGLTSIISGTLPLEVFGRRTYGAHVGWMSAARQFTAAFAPFAFSLMLAGAGTTVALSVLALVGVLGVAVFVTIAVLARAPAALA